MRINRKTDMFEEYNAIQKLFLRVLDKKTVEKFVENGDIDLDMVYDPKYICAKARELGISQGKLKKALGV